MRGRALQAGAGGTHGHGRGARGGRRARAWRKAWAGLGLAIAMAGVGVGGMGGVSSRAVAGEAPRQAAREGREWSAGPLLHSFPLTLESGTGLEAAGPFYYRHWLDDGSLWAVPPLVSVYRSADGDRGDVYVLPPAFAWHRYGQDRKWQLMQWLGGSNVDAIEAPDTRRFQVFPFFFWQDSPDDSRDYWAVMPFYGTLKGRLFRDESEFVLFPLWLESRKGSVRTRNVLFPFFHLRDGPGMQGWQWFPVAGRERLAAGTRTNLSDEVVITPGHDKTFALWPLWFRNRLGLGTTNESRVDAVLPLWYAERSPARDHTSVLWPFGSVTDDRAEGYRQWNLPWPLVGFARGEGKTLDRVLPLFSVGHNKTLEAQTYLWPLYRRRHLHTPVIDRDRWQLGVVLYSDLKEKNLETGKGGRRIDSWPFFSWSKDSDGRERFQAISVLEPFGKGTGIRRNWSPVWSVWRDERDPVRGLASRSVLWNLYRRDRADGVTKGSILFGLVRYEQTSAGRRWRWFDWGAAADGKEATASATETKDVPKHR